MSKKSEKICPFCASTDDVFFKLHAGCPECYHAFSKNYRIFVEIMGGIKNYEYKGSLPKRIKGYRSTLVNRLDVKLKLQKAIENEEYEKAALYRDYLKVLDGRQVFDGENKDE